MAENFTTLNTRIQLKYDTLAAWNASTLILKAGEVAIATVPTGGTGAMAGQLPQILIKVGDGTHTFAQLDYIQAKAADVYAWAKTETLAYNALPEQLRTEIANLQTAVGDGGSVAEAIDDAIEAALGNLNLTKGTGAAKFATVVEQTNGKIEVTYNNLTADDIPELAQAKITGLTTDIARINTLENQMTTAEAAIGNLEDKLDGIGGTVVDAIDDALDTAKAYAETEAAAAQTAAEATAAADATTKANAAETAAKGYVDGKVADIEAAIEELEDTYAAKAYETKVDTLEDEVATLIDEDTGKSVRDIAAEETAKIVAEAPEAYDTLKEIADWIADHPETVGELNTKIAQNTAAIDELQEALDEEIERATGAEEALDGRLDTAEGDIDTIQGQLNGFGNTTGTVKAYVDNAIGDVNEAINDVDGALAEEVAAREAAIGTNNTGLLGDDVYTVIGAEKTRATAKEVELLGTTADAATANTIYGAKKAATAAQTTADTATAKANAAQADVDVLETTVSNLNAAVVKTINAEDGLTATAGANNTVTIGIDEANWTFILNCGGAN